MRRVQAAVLALALLAAACGDASGSGEERVSVVATTTILGDVVRAVAGDDADVAVILPVGADPHDYQPSARQVAAIANADLVVANGLGLEQGLGKVLDEAGRLLEVGPQLDPRPFGDGDDDPHVWMDPRRMADAARLVAGELAAAHPAVDWAGRAEAYAVDLLAADEKIAEILAAVPEERRILVTNHDSLGYFADRYGLTVVGTVIPGGATLAEPSSAELAELVAVIERTGVPAIFAETTEPAALAEALAAEAGGIEVVELYVGSLGEPGSGAATLAGMLITDAERIAGALG